MEMNETIKTIFERKSVRRYAPGVLKPEDLELIVKAGFAAPSARNTQPWTFAIITDREILDGLAADLPYAKMLADVPTAIIVCGDMKVEAGRKHWVEDCSAATQNILLAAEALGYGAVWTAAYPEPDRMDAVRRHTSMPEDVIPLCVIPIGTPQGSDMPKDKYDKSKVVYNSWK